jgi:hypothetical protein
MTWQARSDQESRERTTIGVARSHTRVAALSS